MFSLRESAAGIDDFLVYLLLGLVFLALFIAIYVRITPYKEIQLIRQGNTAAALSLSGAMLGFVMPLASAIEHSVALADMLLWAAVALVVQLLAYGAVRLLIPSIAADIPAGKAAQGLFLGVLSLAAGLLSAAAMTY